MGRDDDAVIGQLRENDHGRSKSAKFRKCGGTVIRTNLVRNTSLLERAGSRLKTPHGLLVHLASTRRRNNFKSHELMRATEPDFPLRPVGGEGGAHCGATGG